MKKVFVLISDENYLEHAKSLFYSAKTIGNWQGDLCLIANNVREEFLKDFEKFGVEIINVKIDNYYYANYFIFDTKMKKWDYIVYMDCDFTIFGDINNIVKEEIKEKKLISVDIEPFCIHEYFCQGWNENEKNISLLDLSSKYDLNKKGFNAGYIEFNTEIITDETLSDLLSLSNQLQHINNHTSPKGSDQPIFNLYFINDLNYIEENKICYWKNSNEFTAAQHHCRWDAPWTNNFYSTNLGKTYFSNYVDNLNGFYASIN